jgi:helicase
MNSICLNPAQQEVWDHGLLTSGFSCVLQMPTGSGKTWLSALAIKDSLRRGHRAIYLSPLRALAEELNTKWGESMEGTSVGIFTGDYGAQGRTPPVPYEDARLLIMTPERLDACTRNWRSHWSWIPEVDLVVIDELHLLGDPGRGARLEGAISRLRRLNPFARFLGLSATLGNRGELADWLEGVEFACDWRPVPLRWRLSRFRKAQEKPDLLCREAAGVRDAGGQSLVFVQSRRRSEALAAHLSAQGIRAGFHHAGLQHSQRRSVEDAFRTNRTPVLVATGTLEMGLNLPARQVVLYDLQGYDDGEFSPLATNTVWQRAGRAGRPGLDDQGEVVLFAPSWDKQADRYERGRFEQIKSGFENRASFDEQVLIEIQSGMGRSKVQLERIFETSLAKQQKLALPLDRSIEEMTDAGIVDLHPETGDFRVTPLGRIAIRQMLRPATVLHIQQFLRATLDPTFFDLLVLAATSEDCEPRITVDFEELENLADNLSGQRSCVFSSAKSDGFGAGGKQLLSALKTATVILDWTLSGDAESVAEKWSCYPFEIVRLCESMDRLLMAVASVQRLLDPEPQEGEEKVKSPLLRRVELLRQMVINGLGPEPALLTCIEGIGAKWARKLVQSSINSLELLASAPTNRLTQLGKLTEKRADKWIRAARIADKTAVTDAASALPIPVYPICTDLGMDPYRLRRAVELTVTTLNPAEWQVTGGLEPHRVRNSSSGLTCDCQDFTKGNTCKHILAIKHNLGDAQVSQAIERIGQATSGDFLDLTQLWFSR